MSDERKQARVADRLAVDHMRAAISTEFYMSRKLMRQSRGGDLTLPDFEPTKTLAQVLHERAVRMLDDIAANAPLMRDRLRALEILAKLHVSEMQIRAELELGNRRWREPMPEQAPAQAQKQDGVSPSNVLTKQEAVHVLREKMKLTAVR